MQYHTLKLSLSVLVTEGFLGLVVAWLLSSLKPLFRVKGD